MPYTLVIAQPPTTIIYQTKTSTSTIVIAVIGAVVGMAILLAICAGLGIGVWWYRRRQKRYAAAPWLAQRRSGYGSSWRPSGRPSRGGSGVPIMQETSGGESSGWRGGDTSGSLFPALFPDLQVSAVLIYELGSGCGAYLSCENGGPSAGPCAVTRAHGWRKQLFIPKLCPVLEISHWLPYRIRFASCEHILLRPPASAIFENNSVLT